MKILIVNAGGNVSSLKNILNHCGYKAKIYKTENDFKDIDVIFLPGIGSFDQVIKRLKALSIFEKLKTLNLENKVHIIGICVGMQIFFDSSEEGQLEGLKFMSGKVKKFKSLDGTSGLHMGWNNIKTKEVGNNFDNKKFYFAHNYYVECKQDLILAESSHIIKFPTMVKKDKIIGIQFHPEKSHQNGIDLFKYILNELIENA